MADELAKQAQNSGYVYYKTSDSELISQIRKDVPRSIDDILNGADKEMLFKAFEEVLKRREVRTDKIRSRFNSVTREVFTIEEKSEHITNLLKLNKTLTFSGIFSDNASKSEIVVTFLAMLELIKLKKISIRQDSIFDDIIISSFEEAAAI